MQEKGVYHDTYPGNTNNCFHIVQNYCIVMACCKNKRQSHGERERRSVDVGYFFGFLFLYNVKRLRMYGPPGAEGVVVRRLRLPPDCYALLNAL